MPETTTALMDYAMSIVLLKVSKAAQEGRYGHSAIPALLAIKRKQFLQETPIALATGILESLEGHDFYRA